jgi:hypothetical protein
MFWSLRHSSIWFCRQWYLIYGHFLCLVQMPLGSGMFSLSCRRWIKFLPWEKISAAIMNGTSWSRLLALLVAVGSSWSGRRSFYTRSWDDSEANGWDSFGYHETASPFEKSYHITSGEFNYNLNAIRYNPCTVLIIIIEWNGNNILRRQYRQKRNSW